MMDKIEKRMAKANAAEERAYAYWMTKERHVNRCAIVCPGPSVTGGWVKMIEDQGRAEELYDCIIAVCHGIMATYQADWLVAGDENAYNDPDLQQAYAKQRPFICAPYGYLVHDEIYAKYGPLVMGWERLGMTTQDFSSIVAIVLAIYLKYPHIDIYGMDLTGLHGIGPQVQYTDGHFGKEKAMLNVLQKQMMTQHGIIIRRCFPPIKAPKQAEAN